MTWNDRRPAEVAEVKVVTPDGKASWADVDEGYVSFAYTGDMTPEIAAQVARGDYPGAKRVVFYDAAGEVLVRRPRPRPRAGPREAVDPQLPVVGLVAEVEAPGVSARAGGKVGCMTAYEAAPDRYDSMEYRFCGRSGLKLPVVSLGLWQNFGDDKPADVQRAILRRAFDRGITHFDLANNYGPPYGQAEVNFGHFLQHDFAPYRDELLISTKAGWDMWPGPYGQGGGSRKYVLASLDQSLDRLGLDYVDIFYSHRYDPETPIEETMMALDYAVASGKALYAGISSYSAKKTHEAATIARELGIPLLIHQPSYSMLNRWIETDLLDELEEQGMGCIVFTALAQGLLTDRYLQGIPADSRAARDTSLPEEHLDESVLRHVRALNEIAQERGQSSPRWRCSGRCATSGSPRWSSGLRRSSSSTSTSTPCRVRRSARRSSPGSTSTPSTRGSTSGQNRPRTEQDRTVPGRSPPDNADEGPLTRLGSCGMIGS